MYYTVKQIAELIRPNWIESVRKEGKYIVITTATDRLAAGPTGHKAPMVAPRIKIRSF